MYARSQFATIGTRHRRDDERGAAPGRAIVQVREQHAERDRRDQVAQSAAGLDDRPVAARDREVVAFAEHRHAGRAQRIDREVGRVVHQRRHQEVAGRHREEQERERIEDALRDLVAEHGPHQAREHRDERVLLRRVHAGRMRGQPQQPAARERHERPRLRLRRHRGESIAQPPDEPGADREDEVAVRERAGVAPAVPQHEHRLEVDRDERDEAEREHAQRHRERMRAGASRNARARRGLGGRRVVRDDRLGGPPAAWRDDGRVGDRAAGFRHVRYRWR